MKDLVSGPKTAIAPFVYGEIYSETFINLLQDCSRAAYVNGKADGIAEVKEKKPSGYWPVVMLGVPQDALVERSRALCVKRFLEETDAEVLLMIDHDITWRGSGVYNTPYGEQIYEGDLLHLARCCHQTKGVIGGLVSKKTKHQGPAALFKVKEDLQIGLPRIVDVHYIGAAFTAYHRDVLQAVSNTMKEIPPGFRPIFNTCVVPHPHNEKEVLHLSEDWAFCHRATQLGYRVDISTMPLTGHMGKYKYTVIGDSKPKEAYEKECQCNSKNCHKTTDNDTRISLIHATRGRPIQALETFEKWLNTADNVSQIEYIFSIDNDDEKSIEGLKNANYEGLSKEPIVLIGPPKFNVAATNRGAYKSTGDILVQVHDDVDPLKGWDTELIKRLDPEKPQLLRVNDGLDEDVNQKPWLIAIQICTRKWAKKLGGIFYPEYRSVFCDDDASVKAYKDGCVIDATDLLFKHNWKGASHDETIKNSYQRSNWEHGEKLFHKRKDENFPDASERWGM